MSEQPTDGHFFEGIAQESVGESLAEQARAVPPGTEEEGGLTDTGPGDLTTAPPLAAGPGGLPPSHVD